jgi:RimJ/RimL family protein N-acetyltransferase
VDVPDEPRWVETRWLLRSGQATVADGVVISERLGAGSVVELGSAAGVRRAVAGAGEGFELVVQIEALDGARAALPDWNVALATVHALPQPHAGGPEPGVILSAPPERRWLDQIPDEEDRLYAELAPAIAVHTGGGSDLVAVCQASAVTETLWDVGIDTYDEHARRRGYAAATYRALAAHMATLGRQPVWAAEDENVASMRLAAKLGFRPVARLAVLSPPAAGA